MIRVFSLRLRMVLLFCTVVGVFLTVTLFTIYGIFSNEIVSQLNCSLQRVGNTVVAQLTSDPAKRNVEELDVPKEYFEVLDPAGNILERSKNLNGDPIDLHGGIDYPAVVFRTLESKEYGRQRLALIPFRESSQPRVLAITMPTSHDDMVLAMIRRLFLWVLPLALFLTAAISIWYVGRSLRPVAELTRQAGRMTEEIGTTTYDAAELRQKLQIPLSVANSGDELGRLASAYNTLFTRLNAALRQHRQFASDAAHELRTPLHILRGEMELLLSQPRACEEYVKTLHVVDNELLRLTRIVEALFTLSMADAGQLRLNSEPLYLNEVIEQACSLITPLARAKRISILRDLSWDVPYYGDEALLRELSVIFLDNAIKYSPPGTQVRVYLERAGGQIRIMFEDQGYGIAREHLPHIFERFYRVRLPGNSETRSGGLGLSIAQAIARAQGGDIECDSVPSDHTIFTVILRDVAGALPERLPVRTRARNWPREVASAAD
ncbi:MAG: sensor histidine kinase [Candidatus Acidiferrales bacterium]